MGYLIPLMETFETGEKPVCLEALSGKVLKEILKYYYNVKLFLYSIYEEGGHG